jgi:two-component system LytT family response regulator
MQASSERSVRTAQSLWRVGIAHPDPAPIAEIVAEFRQFEVVSATSRPAQVAQLANGSATDVLVLGSTLSDTSDLAIVKEPDSPESPLVILVARSDRAAAALYEQRVFDFIIEPAAPNRIRRALSHAQRYLERTNIVAALHASAESLRYRRLSNFERPVALVTPRRTLLLAPAEIDWVEAASSRITVCARSRQYPVQETLSQFVARLPAALFVRVRRSMVVNVRCIQSIESRGHGELRVTLQGGRHIAVGTTYRNFVDRLVSP